MAAEEKLIDKLKTPQWRAIIASLLIFVFLIVWTQYFTDNSQVLYNISYSKFIEQLDAGNIKSVTIKKLVVTGVLNKDIEVTIPGEVKAVTVKNFRTFLPSFQGEALLGKLEEKHVIITVEPEEERSLLWQIVLGLLPWALIIGVWIFLMRRTQQQMQGGPGGVFSFGASKARLFDVKKPGITFKDVAGMDKVKNELMETVEFLKDPSRYAGIGAKGAQGCASGGTSRHREDPSCARNSRRGRRAVFQHQRLRVHRDVCRRRGFPGKGHVQKGQGGTSEHYFYRRN